MPTSYPTKQAAVDATFGAGTKIVGEVANIADAPNDKFDPSKPVDSVVNPRTVKKQNGTVISVQRADGTPDTLTLSDAKVVDSGGGKGGVGYDVLEGGKTTPKATGSPVSDWDRLDSNGQIIPKGDTTTPAVALHDPKAPAGSQPYTITGGSELGDPSTWTQIREDPSDPTSRVVGLYDPKSQKVAASVSQSTTDKDSDPSKWTPVYRVPGDSSSGIIGQQDPVNHVLHPVAAAPDNTQIVTTPQAIYTLDKTTGKIISKQDLADNVNKQSVTFGGKIYTFDPKDGTYTLPTNVQQAATVGNSTTLKDLVWYDDQGNEVGRQPNSNYGKAPVTAPTPNTVAPYIQVPDPQNPSQLIWVENKGQVTASDALKQLASHLSGQVVDGKISVDEAKTLIDAANTKQTNDIAQQNATTQQQQNVTTAAGDILSNVRGNAQTGAGLLQQRVQAATSGLNSILGLAGQGQRSGNMGGGLMSAPAGLGENLVQGLTGWTADLMGGQGTLDSAARLVQMADPQSNVHDPATQQAIGVLQQMLGKYQDLSGTPHPAVAATQAAQQSQVAGGMAAPNTASPYNPSDIQWNQPANAADVAGRTNVGLNMGTTPGFTAPVGGYATYQPGTYGPLSGAMPVPVPQPAFIAPPMPAVTV